MPCIVPIDMPVSCIECPFHSPFEFFKNSDDTYSKASRCIFAPEEIEDPWRDASWMVNHKEEWCPLIDAIWIYHKEL